jgi:hypothetical protein
MCRKRKKFSQFFKIVLSGALFLTRLYSGEVWPQGNVGTAGSGGLQVGGQLGITSQWYSMESDPLLLISPRRPGNLHRFVLTPVFSAGEFAMPVNIIFSSRQTNVVTFQAPVQNFGQFLRNPLNTFRMAPTYKWARGIIGSQVVNHSSLTTGDAKVFGAGFELTPEDLIHNSPRPSLHRANTITKSVP